MTHEKRITKLETIVKNHEERITNIENKYENIINGINKIDKKLPKHPILNLLAILGAGGLIVTILSVVIYG
jgi:hypothetical protein